MVPGGDGAIPVACRVVDPREGKPGEISETSLFTAQEEAVVEAIQNLPEHTDRRLGVTLTDVGDPREESRVIEVSTLLPDF